MILNRGVLVRLYPTPEQEDLFMKHIGCRRFIYNYCLEKNNKLEQEGKPIIRGYKLHALIKEAKYDGEHNFLQDAH